MCRTFAGSSLRARRGPAPVRVVTYQDMAQAEADGLTDGFQVEKFMLANGTIDFYALLQVRAGTWRAWWH